MKITSIAKFVFIPLFLMCSSLAFAQDEKDSVALASEEIVEEDDGIYAKDSSGAYIRDSEGNRVRVGSRSSKPVAKSYVSRERNCIEIERDDVRLVLNGDDGTFAIYGVAE